MTKFKVGDKVYCPAFFGGAVNVLLEPNDTNYALSILNGSTRDFTREGKYDHLSKASSIFHATQENYELLSKLYPQIAFEEPVKQPTSREIIQAYIDKQGYCPCWCEHSNEFKLDENSRVGIIVRYDKDYYITCNGSYWNYAVPFDPSTMTEITELP